MLATTQPAGATPPESLRTSPTGTNHTTTITLITGDQVVVQDGRAIAVRPGDGRDDTVFSTYNHDGHSYVIPADAEPLVASGQLDRRLFDITQLVDFDYDDAHRNTLPLIVTYDADRAAPRFVGATDVRELASIDAVALAATKTGATWAALTNGDDSRRVSAGVTKIWLDGQRTATLDRSTAQIGAPTAWDAGLTGAGVTIAVLDTGVDQTHPDLADREIGERNFSDSPDNVDHVGHGTHVASIAAGTGAMSDGRYRGVAWGASILDGKVLNESGDGYDSAIIAGMEWAVDQGADIVNLSIGSTDTAAVDPVEEAINRLSAEHGTLFVVAAGNTGPAAESILSPGSADAALTVGAVDRADELAPFSSRGPRLGDGAVKPDITAPGIDIVAALHTEGTMKPPVVDGYTTLSGTSMATPHVAGAAALLAQRHPDWTGAQLKAVLSGSAAPNAEMTAFEQGAGRVDVAAATAAKVISEPTSLSFGTVAWPHDDDEPVVRELTYRNIGATDTTLALAVHATDPDGAPSSLFTLSTDEVTVPAGGTTTVTVTGDTTHATVDGPYSGVVVATSDELVTRTPLAITREVESYSVTVNYVGRDGAPASDAYSMLAGLDNDISTLITGHDGTATIRLPKGRYVIQSVVTSPNLEFDVLAQPGLMLDADTTTTADARIARPVSITPPESARLLLGDIGYEVQTETGTFTGGLLTNDLSTVALAQVGPTLPDSTVVGLINTQWLTEDNSFYGLCWFPPGVPGGFTREVEPDDLATLDVYLGPAPAGVTPMRIATPQPAQGSVSVYSSMYQVAAPGQRTEYLSTEAGVRWSSSFLLFDEEEFAFPAEFSDPERSFEAGQTYRRAFNHAVFGPALPPSPMPWGARTGDDLAISLPMFSDAAGNPGYTEVESANSRLYLGTELVGESSEPGTVDARGLPAEEREYRFTSEASRPALFDTSTSISAEWTFRSANAAGEEPVAVDLNAIRFRPRLDSANSAPAGQRQLVPMVVQEKSGMITRPSSLSAEVSYDDGATWQQVRVLFNLAAELYPPADATSVSLRASAADREGNTVTQTVIRAYLLR